MKNSLGQLIITGIQGTSLRSDEKKFIEEEEIGGAILFSQNYESPAQLAELVNSIQTLKKEHPIFIAVDHEGGRIQRFKDPFSHFPPMLEIAKLNSPKLFFEIHQIMAKELRACGININLAPCSDILTNINNKVIGDRSFGEDPENCSKFVTAAVRGLQTQNVIACAKHFPGHGSTTKDSHFDLPIVKTKKEDLLRNEFLPFSRAIKAKVELIMMGHLVVDAFDSDLPSSLSSITHNYLRNELRYKNLIISDDMQMGAITKHFGLKEAALMAINAGSDIIEYRDFEFAREALEGLKEGREKKKVNDDNIKSKLSRINLCKLKYLKDYNPIYLPSVVDAFRRPSTQKLIDQINQRLEDLA